MIDDLAKEVKAQLYERVKSPLFGAFALSWVAWNYRAVLAVFSKMPFKETLDYLQSLYPSVWEWLGYCFGGPMLTAVAFLLVYPHPARWMYRYWANQHKELKKVQQEIEDETPLTQEEAKALRKASLTQAAEVQGQIRDMSQTNRELNERIRVLTEENIRLATERDGFKKAAEKAEERLSSQSNGTLPNTSRRRKTIAYPVSAAIRFDGLPEATKSALGEHFGQGHSLMKDVFLLLVAAGGEAHLESIADYFDANPIDIRAALSGLLKSSLVELDNSGAYMLTNKSTLIVQNLSLTSVLPRISLD